MNNGVLRQQLNLASCFSLPGVKKPLGQYGPPGVADTTSGSAPTTAKDEDDDDIDLFGSDEEVRRW